jgi:hypothetical protein
MNEEEEMTPERAEMMGHLLAEFLRRDADDKPIAEKDLGNGKRLTIFPLTFGRARLGIGPVDMGYNDDEW